MRHADSPISSFPSRNAPRQRRAARGGIAAGVIVVALFGFVCYAGAQTSKPPIVDTAVERLAGANSEEDLNKAILWLYEQFGDPNLTPLLVAIWNEDVSRYPGLPWDKLRAAQFRLEFAGLLAQWLRETKSHVEMMPSIKAYVISYRDSKMLPLRAAAINFTADSDSCDVDALVKIAHEGNVYSAMAIHSLATILGTGAESLLLNLRANAGSTEIRSVIDRELSSLGSHPYPDSKYFRENVSCTQTKALRNAVKQ